MKIRWLMIVAGVTACASTDAILGESGGPTVVPDAAPSPDGGSDSAPIEDAAPCDSDCEYFPATCTADTFCPNGPFDPNTTGGSIDSRAQINVIRGRSPSDVWAAGALGALAHFDGTSWTRSDPGERQSLKALWLRDSEEIAFGVIWQIYARGLESADGGAAPSPGGWTIAPAATAPPEYFAYPHLTLVSAWAPPGSDSLWCAMHAFERGRASGLWRLRLSSPSTFELAVGVPRATCAVLPCSRMTSIHGASANTLWAVGAEGSAVRIADAESDTPRVDTFNTQTWNTLSGVWAASDTEAWAVGATGTIRHYTGDPRFWDVVADVPTSQDLNAVAGSSPSDIWAVGDAGVILHYDGKTWSRVKVAGLGSRRPKLTTVWVASPGHVWVGGHGFILSLGGKP